MRILFVTSRFPFPPRKGDQVRAYEEIRRLGADHEIGLVSASVEPIAATSLAEMRRYCRRIDIVRISRLVALGRIAALGTTSSLPFQVLYFDALALRRAIASALEDGPYDVVHAQLLRVLPHLWSLSRPPVVVDLMDAFAPSIAGRGARAHPLLRFLYEGERRRVARYEAAVLDRFGEVVVISESDRAALGGGRGVTATGHGVDLERFPFGAQSGREPRTVVMTGNLDYGPNIDAALWFARSIWPLVRAREPRARLRLVGARPTRTLRTLRSFGIEVTGEVADIGADLRSSTIAVCPIRTGTGIQNKVLEALASGTPLISTTLGNAGVGGVAERDLLIADDPAAFATHVVALFDDAARRTRLASAGRAFVVATHDWATHIRALEDAYARAIRA